MKGADTNPSPLIPRVDSIKIKFARPTKPAKPSTSTPMPTPGDRFYPVSNVRISPREVLDVGTLFIRYRTFADGRMLPHIGRCAHYAWARWVKKYNCRRVAAVELHPTGTCGAICFHCGGEE